MDASSTQSVNILETFNAYQFRIYKLDFCSFNFHIFRFSQSDRGEIDVYRFMSKQIVNQISRCFFFYDPLSHLAIDASSCMKLMPTTTDFKWHHDLTLLWEITVNVSLERADKWITALNMSLSTECAAALLSLDTLVVMYFGKIAFSRGVRRRIASRHQ